MNNTELGLVIQKVLLAQSDQELATILAENPTLLEQETLEILRGFAQQAKDDGNDEIVEALRMAIERIVTFQTQSSQPISKNNAKLAWVVKTR